MRSIDTRRFLAMRTMAAVLTACADTRGLIPDSPRQPDYPYQKNYEHYSTRRSRREEGLGTCQRCNERRGYRRIDGQTVCLFCSKQPARPIERRTYPKRNDPCHCGSGKKYKKCHGTPK